MLSLNITIKPEAYDEANSEIIPAVTKTIQLEHSLVSLSKWESKWHKPFLHSDKNEEEIMDYIKFMTITQNVPDELYLRLSEKNVQDINEYINNPMTATTFKEEKSNTKNRERVTSELVYYWMVAYNIPWDCQKWHLNRLMTLIRICGIKNQPPKKTKGKDLLSKYADINARNRARFNSKG